MRRLFVLFGAACGLIASTSHAETGMGLVIDETSKEIGKIRRIDLKNGKVVHTSSAFGSNMVNARFSPDGTRLVAVSQSREVTIRDLDGKILKRFAAFGIDSGNALDKGERMVSWTKSGIWVGGVGRMARYDTAGVRKALYTLKGSGSGANRMTDAEAKATRVKTVSSNEQTAGGRPKFAASVLLGDRNGNTVPVVKLWEGCSVGPSPDGSRLTGNLWETGKQHQTMHIYGRKGGVVKHMNIFDIVRPDGNRLPGSKWSWNRQTWSSNSADIILIPAGRGYPQMTETVIPFIYNLKTKRSYYLYKNWNASSGVRWYIHDFYVGKTSQGMCKMPAGCDDGNPCTEDICDGGSCKNPAISGCCQSASQCPDDGNRCTAEACVDHKCVAKPVANCCQRASDCDDDNVCTDDACNKGTGKCKNVQRASCCTKDVDCADKDMCTRDRCDTNSHQCDIQPIANCCDVASDCDDGDSCTDDACEGDRCSNTVIDKCCHDDQDCNDADECTVDRCGESDRCANETIPHCDSTANEPSITIENPVAGDVWKPGSTVNVRWSTKQIDEVVIYLSTDGGDNWDTIGQVDSEALSWGDFPWKVPDDKVSERAVIRVEGYFQEDSDDSATFAIGHSPSTVSSGSRDTDKPRANGSNPEGILLGGCTMGGPNPTHFDAGWVLLCSLGLGFIGRRRRKAAA